LRFSADTRLLFGARIDCFDSDLSVTRNNLRPRKLEVYPQLKDEKLKQVRAPGDHLLQKPMVAGSVFYYQLRDML